MRNVEVKMECICRYNIDGCDNMYIVEWVSFPVVIKQMISQI